MMQVEGAEAGFNDSWWPATVVAEKPCNNLEVKYKTVRGPRPTQTLQATPIPAGATHMSSAKGSARLNCLMCLLQLI